MQSKLDLNFPETVVAQSKTKKCIINPSGKGESFSLSLKPNNI